MDPSQSLKRLNTRKSLLTDEVKGMHKEIELFAKLYDCDKIKDLLNMPQEYMTYYNAWIKIPGEYLSYLKRERKVEIKGKTLKVFGTGRKDIGKAPDLFSFVKKQYGKNVETYNIIWSLARLNKMELQAFLNKFANKW